MTASAAVLDGRAAPGSILAPRPATNAGKVAVAFAKEQIKVHIPAPLKAVASGCSKEPSLGCQVLALVLELGSKAGVEPVKLLDSRPSVALSGHPTESGVVQSVESQHSSMSRRPVLTPSSRPPSMT